MGCVARMKTLQLAGVFGPVQGTIVAGSMSGAELPMSFGPFTVFVASGNWSGTTWSGGKPRWA